MVATLGIFNLTYPTVLSSMVAGVVDSIGEGVTKVKVGDRVVSGTGIWTSKGDHKFGGMQRFTIVEEFETVEVSIAYYRQWLND
jgi:NADPH:quinone reductase-like Zn-dependent oxidoreductase